MKDFTSEKKEHGHSYCFGSSSSEKYKTIWHGLAGISWFLCCSEL